MAGSLLLIAHSTGNTAPSLSVNSNSGVTCSNGTVDDTSAWQAGDLLIVVVQDTLTGTTLAVNSSTAVGGKSVKWEALSAGTNESLTVSDCDVATGTGAIFARMWSSRLTDFTPGTGLNFAQMSCAPTYAGSSGIRRTQFWRLRPDSGKTIPLRASRRPATGSDDTKTDTGSNTVNTFTMSAAAGAYDIVEIVGYYTSASMTSAPNLDPSNASTYKRSDNSTTFSTSYPETGGTPGTAVDTNGSGCGSFGEFYTAANGHRPNTGSPFTQQVKWVSTPGGTARAVVACIYYAETPTQSATASVAATTTLAPTGNKIASATAALSVTTSLVPSASKQATAALAAVVTLAPSANKIAHATAALSMQTLLAPQGRTARLGYINRHDTQHSASAGDQGPISVAVYIGDLVALLMSTSDPASYGDVYASNCSIECISGAPTYSEPYSVTSATWAVVSGTGRATYTTSAAHRLIVGQRVIVTGGTNAAYRVGNATTGLGVAVTVITSTTFSVAMVSNPGSFTGTATAQGCIPFTVSPDSNPNVRIQNDDGINGLYTRIWICKVTAVSASPTAILTLRAATPGRNVLLSISPGAGNYFSEADGPDIDRGTLLRTGNANLLIPWAETAPWLVNRGFGMLLVGRYDGGARGADIDFNADGTTDLAKFGLLAGLHAGPGGGGDLLGVSAPGVSTVWAADAYYIYPGITRPTSSGIFLDPDGSGDACLSTLLIVTRRTFETVLEIDEAQPIHYIKGYHLGTATEEDSNGPGSRYSFGVVPHAGHAIGKAHEIELAQPLILTKSRHITWGLGNPGPGPFFGYELTAWAYMLGSGDLGDIRLNLMDGSTVLQTSPWFTLTHSLAPYSMTITSAVAARSTLVARIEARTFGLAYSPAVVAVLFTASGGHLGVATELDGIDAGAIRVRIASQDFIVNKIQM